MRTSTLVILAAGLLAATTLKWSELRDRRSLGDIYQDAKAGHLRNSPYRKITGLMSLIMFVVWMYMVLSGD